jgi:hypothetical protein
MNDRRTGTRFLFYLAALLVLLGGSPGVIGRAAAGQIERENNDVQITAVDTVDFPTVSVRVLTTAAGGAPNADLSRLILRENGVPITDVTTAQVPVGVDLAFVLDANPDFLQFDDRSGLNRRDKTAASVARYAGQFMDPAGLDRVSVVVPDEVGESTAFLTQDATRPADLADAVAAYAPVPPRVTPLQAMLAAAVDHLAAGEEGRFRAVLLFTDGARLDSQLDAQALVEQAQAAGVMFYAAILGAEASEEEVANVARLTEPTNGLNLHMPEPEATDSIYEIFRAQGRQAQLSYRSDMRQNGTHEVSVSLGNVRAAAEFGLALAAPEVTIETERTSIRRAGSAVDTPLALLQPAILPLTVRIDWPDGRPRQLTEVTFRVDGVAQPAAVAAAPDAAGQLPLPWDISERDAGTYALEVEIADELGFRATSAPVEITIEVSRPSPPTPTVAPTRAPLPALSLGGDARWPLLLLPALFVAAAGVWLWHRARPRLALDTDPIPKIIPASGPPPDDRHVAVLNRGDDGDADQIELAAADVTLGREADAVEILIDDPSVSRLHARIRRNATGDYWLYDEGSITGTFLNYERLGLAPRRLQHGDVVQLGRVTLRFRLELPRATADRGRPTTDGRALEEEYDEP